MREQRMFERTKPPLNEQMLTIHGFRKHVYGRVVDESTGGLGIALEDPAEFRPGERLLVHRHHHSRIRMATVRHVDSDEGGCTRMGVMWNLP